ncbi:uncharacterized protein LOC123320786 isoform X2 [Coccinella septempunctata]|uniref:uncharacterized protein LOC123320786 isoform X2 n=1 Tax=Coccinella septempunctata TaxID=41139 RepID=UPI001D06A694|nr:uncharacterized protein LOC123320786 isoform X2 [Coccinella septempunctata]
MLLFLAISFFALGFSKSTLTEREYKVNNIVFLKDHYSWCQVTPIQQIITSPGYQSVTINNNICVGACWSYSIPKTQPAEPGEIIRPYCDSCQPNVTKCYHVTLTSEDTNLAGPKTIQKRIEIIKSCHCRPCDKVPKLECDLSQENTVELPQTMYTNKDAKTTITSSEVPDKDIMFLLPKINANSIVKLLNEDAGGLDNRQNVSSKLLKILNIWEKMPNGSASKTEPEEPGKIFQFLHTPERKDLNDLVSYIDTQDVENTNLDTQKLSKILEKYRKNKGKTNTRDIWLGTPNNEKILEDLRQSQLPPSFGLEGSTLGIKHHYKGSHIGMGINTNKVEDLQVVTLPEVQDDLKTTTPKSDSTPHPSKNNHYVLEEELVHGKMEHLVKGPHGSLVLRPEIKVEKKLNLETDSLTPNHQGVVITYTGDDQNAPKLIDV